MVDRSKIRFHYRTESLSANLEMMAFCTMPPKSAKLPARQPGDPWDVAFCFPHKELNNLGVLDVVEPYQQHLKRDTEYLRFFGEESVEAWEWRWEEVAQQFRLGLFSAYSIIAWLRGGEIFADRLRLRSYNEAKFEEAIRDARSLTMADRRDIPRLLTPLFARSGVALVFVPSFQHLSAAGAAFVSGSGRRALCLPCSFRDEGVFWGTLFHEAYHLLRHVDVSDFFFDQWDDDSNYSLSDPEREESATRFAQDLLIPKQTYDDFVVRVDAPNIKRRDITNFARRVGVPPGVIVDRLRADRHAPPWKYQNLCRKVNHLENEFVEGRSDPRRKRKTRRVLHRS